jgi:hypothetical protein
MRERVMGERVCRDCQNSFQPSKFQPAQAAGSDPDCQRRRRNDYHRRKVATDPVYRLVCLDSVQKWRAEHPGYWTQLCERNPGRAERNRQRQRQRDQQRRQRRLANNNAAPHLANNSPAIPQVIELKAAAPSCQQQPSGQTVVFCPIKGSEPCSPPIRSTICITCFGPSTGPFARLKGICA